MSCQKGNIHNIKNMLKSPAFWHQNLIHINPKLFNQRIFMRFYDPIPLHLLAKLFIPTIKNYFVEWRLQRIFRYFDLLKLLTRGSKSNAYLKVTGLENIQHMKAYPIPGSWLLYLQHENSCCWATKSIVNFLQKKFFLFQCWVLCYSKSLFRFQQIVINF